MTDNNELNNKDKQCYFCSGIATSVEHVPPKCLYPKGEKYRNNLITVPACNKHNNQKSGIDERMRLFILATNKNLVDMISEEPLKKTIRSIARAPKNFNKLSKDLAIFKKSQENLRYLGI